VRAGHRPAPGDQVVVLESDVEAETQVRKGRAHGTGRPQVAGPAERLAGDAVVVEQVFGEHALGDRLVALAPDVQQPAGVHVNEHAATHFALLCLLSLRPWSAYDLVGHLHRSLDLLWPRAQSNLYVDLKRLAADGLATRATVRVGRRARSTYTITAAGRAALLPWLDQPGLAPVFECEALVKLAYVPAASKPAALAQVAVLAEHARARLALGRRIAEQYVTDDGLPPRLHVNTVMWRFLWEQHQAIARWAAWAEAEIRQWADTDDTPALRRRGKRILRQFVAEIDA
jgi:PadR family transcriptional regulator AphA